MRFLIIDTKSCNIFKYKNLFTKLGLEFEIITKPKITTKNAFLILPGVGNFGFFVRTIEKNDLKKMILNHTKNNFFLLGICVGMQYLFKSSEEDTSAKGLDLIKGNVKKISLTKKIPIIGNYKIIPGEDNKYDYIDKNNKFFFAHSYYCQINQKIDTCYYNNINNFSYLSSFRIGNIIGAQFHPELSDKNGIKFFKKISKLKCE